MAYRKAPYTVHTTDLLLGLRIAHTAVDFQKGLGPVKHWWTALNGHELLAAISLWGSSHQTASVVKAAMEQTTLVTHCQREEPRLPSTRCAVQPPPRHP